MELKFNLKVLFGVTGLSAVFLGVLANENGWLASATLICVVGWIAIAWLSYLFLDNVGSIVLHSYHRKSIQGLTAAYRWLPILVCAMTLFFVVIILTNSVRRESIANSGILVTWAWLIVPAYWYVRWRNTRPALKSTRQ
ncbi:MAG: hypothetical protein AAFN77_03595 [Planctomycetota bacterium]